VREGLRAAGEADLAAWEQVRAFLRETVGESTFEIWLASLELIAVDLEGILILSVPAETVGWVGRRFGRILDGAAQRAGRSLRVTDEVERKAAEPLWSIVAAAASAAPVGLSADARFSGRVSSDGCAVDVPTALSGGGPSDRPGDSGDDQSARQPTYGSAYPSSYTDVYTKIKEVS
jgi:DnaA N-terminal domain